ncbi:tetratricopeptide repeat protein [Ancylomarina sp. DW003]|nr:tetratricopeptide repeat protein [Ancylomarina sp. DW003]MDE5421512.1 tetratricopeptide repeat protein [Ancylomarina sp. DW003]
MKEIQDILSKAKHYFEAEEFQLALSEYQKVIDLDSNQVEANFMIGEIHHQLGDMAKALSYYIRVSDLEPGHSKANVKIEMINTILDYFNRDMHNP